MKRVLIGLIGVFAIGCGEADDIPAEYEAMPGFRVRQQALTPPCSVMVEGAGMLDIETEYLPGVVACENGNAPYEALKAQAVQARGFVYYKLMVEGKTVLSDSQGDQVYSCTGRLPNGPLDKHKQAVAETKGQYLEYNGYIVAPFYVAGQIPANPDPNDPIASCNGAGGSGGLNTERFVTYNWGKANCDIDMTTLGWTPDDCNRNPHNRGAASQNGESCLDGLGWKYQDMLDYYYGADIQLLSGDGQCGGPAPYELTDYDRFCGNRADGDYCFDAATKVTCTDEFGAGSEVCAGDCVDGACTGGVEPSEDNCADLADGPHCLDNVLLAECQGGEVASSVSCVNGCNNGACLDAPDNNVNNTPGINNTDFNNVGGPSVDPMGNPNQQAFPDLISESRGEAGGCSSTGGNSGGALSLLVLALFGWARRRRR